MDQDNERGKFVETIGQAFKNIGPGRILGVGGLFLALIIFFIIFITKFTSPSMEPLYSGLESGDSTRITSQLQSLGLKYELKQGGKEILVPSNEVTRIRLQLAEQGLGGNVLGYELFDKSDGIGTTKFLQDVQYIRALEGELQRTIEAFNSVKGARVHLVLPKRELFSRQKQEPSASIFLRMRGSTRLSSEQVSAVQHLVAAAVPSLTPERISVVDNKGKLLAAGFEDTDSVGAVSSKIEERNRVMENRLSRTIEELLEKTVGFGRVRAEVHAEMDFDRISTNEETFDPEGQVVRSTQSIEETASARDAEGTPPITVGTNLPDANTNSGDSQSSTSAENRTEETVNFEISKKTINHIREAGIIKKLSVAVLVDYDRLPDENGVLTPKPRPEDEMGLLSDLVKGAIGYDADRGDSIEVINMEFRDAIEEEEALQVFFGLGKNDLIRMAELLVLGILVLLVILLVVRPLISRAFEATSNAASAAQAASERLLADQVSGAPALAGPGGGSGVPAPSDAGGEEEQFEELIDIDRVEGRVKASSVKKVGEIVDKHPEKALSIIRAWMYQET
ncbi:MAG: flagellar M-ring protein FliF [Rhodospirillales bacterium]|nr:flagellar M-ring protein FliF [Rhodospirillales bacterium]